MTLKFPLINLISRGHLPLVNKTACLNFAKNIEDGPATRICYEMMKFDDSRDAAKFLETAVETHRVITEGNKAYFSDSFEFTEARNAILLRESGSQAQDPADQAAYVHALIKRYGTIAGIIYLLKAPPEQRKLILDNLKLYSTSTYKLIQQSWPGRVMHLTKDPAYFKRLFNTTLGIQHGALKDKEKESLVKLLKSTGKTVGWGAVIAAGITAAIASISLLWKRVFSKEARQCKSMSGKARTVCMTKARIKACDTAIESAKKALLDCGSAKNEEDCIFKMKIEIRSWTKKKAVEEEKLRKLTNVNTASFDDDKDNSNDPFN